MMQHYYFLFSWTSVFYLIIYKISQILIFNETAAKYAYSVFGVPAGTALLPVSGNSGPFVSA